MEAVLVMSLTTWLLASKKQLSFFEFRWDQIEQDKSSSLCPGRYQPEREIPFSSDINCWHKGRVKLVQSVFWRRQKKMFMSQPDAEILQEQKIHSRRTLLKTEFSASYVSSLLNSPMCLHGKPHRPICPSRLCFRLTDANPTRDVFKFHAAILGAETPLCHESHQHKNVRMLPTLVDTSLLAKNIIYYPGVFILAVAEKTTKQMLWSERFLRFGVGDVQ